MDFFTADAGQRRRAALDEFGRDIGYYVPPELRNLLGFAAEMTPTATLERAGQASQRMLDADRTAMERVGDLGTMLSETAGVAAPIMVANRAAMPIADAVQEGLLGFSVSAQDAGRAVVDRLNQPGPVPTMYSNPVFAPFDMGGASTGPQVTQSPAPSAAPSLYQMLGSDIVARLEDVPSAREIMGKAPEPLGSGFTGITTRGRTVLPEHRSAGFVDEVLTAPTPTSFANFGGRTLFGLVGDLTGRKTVTEVDGTILPTPVRSEAGAEFSDLGDLGYASARSIMSGKMNAASKTDDPYFMFMNMGDQSNDFALHTGRVLGEMFRVAPISSANVPKIDDAIRNIPMSVKVDVPQPDGTVKKIGKTIRPFSDFQSVGDPNYLANYVASLPSGTQRAAFVKGLDRSRLLDMGVPDVGSIRLAVSNPELVGRDYLTAGYRGFAPDMQTGLLSTPVGAHSTYDTSILKQGNAERFDEGGGGIPANLIFRDLSEVQRSRGTGGGLVPTTADYKVFEGSPSRAQQLVDDQVIEMVSTFTEMERRFGRRAALQYANELLSGGRITAEMINSARRANAPSWMLAALAPASGLMSMMPEDEQQ